MKLSHYHQNILLNIAEWSILDFLNHHKRNPLPRKFELDRILRKKSGAFVSVYVNENLRGCIGTFSESEPLFKNVQLMALQAAFEDDRFDPISIEDTKELTVEISVLSPRLKIHDPEEIEIGTHGIYLIHGIRRATLLPQVAVKYNYNAVEFLECCAKNKLGLSKDSWKDSELFVYEAFVFK